MSEPDPIDRVPGNAADREHPWLGLDSFTEQSSGFFYGREDEVGELARRVQRKLLTVLFGQSGLGKTSILRAGIVPRLRPEGYCPVYVRISYAPESPAPSEQIKEAILRATEAFGTWTRSGSADAGESLWEFLHHRDDTLHDFEGRALIPVLIFDQFEEIFTLAQTDEGGRRRAAEFIADLADLVENRAPRALEERMEADDDAAAEFDFARSDYRILIALREDYLAHLEGVKGAMPSITQNRMRLARMNGRQALAAVTLPGGRLVSEEVAEAIVRFVAGDAELINAEVEPSLLSLICRELNNNRIAQGRGEISPDLLAGSHASILSEFYARALHDQPPGVHRFIEDELLTEAGFRENLAEERVLKAFVAAGAAPDALAMLVDRRLLRIEERLDARRVELTHDVLSSVVRSARETRKERELHEEATRQLALQSERERITRKSLVRARQVAAVCAILGVGAIASAAFGYVNMNRAEQTRAMADDGRAEAEKLVTYLLDDFYDQLQPIGRVEMMSDLVARTADYYRRLPAAMRTADTERNRAFVLLRMGMLLRLEGKVDESAKVLDESIALLEQMVARGKVPESVLLHLASAHAHRARVAFMNAEIVRAPQFARRGVELLAPFAGAPKASAQARLAYAEVLTSQGYIEMRNGDKAVATKIMRHALELSGGASATAGLANKLAYIDAALWLEELLDRSGSTAEASLIGESAMTVIDQLLATQPGHLDALLHRSAFEFRNGLIALIERQPGTALMWMAYSTATSETVLRLDPANDRATVMTSIGHGYRALALFRMGRLDAAKKSASASWAAYLAKPTTAYHSRNMFSYALHLAETEADLGERDPLAAATILVRKFAHAAGGTAAGNSMSSAVVSLLDEQAALSIALALGDAPVAPAVGAAAIAHARQTAKPAGASADPDGYFNLAYAYGLDARAAAAAGDLARAESSARQSIAFAERVDILDRIDLPFMQIDHAYILARQQRNAEAAELISAQIAARRAWLAAGSDDQQLRFELAQCLYVATLAQPGAGAAELKQAAALLAGLPAQMQPMRSVKLWRARVDAALKERHA